MAGCGCMAGLTLIGGLARAQDNDDWMQHIRLGVPVTFNVKAKFGINGAFNLPTGQTGGTASGVDHIYDDGYVRVDSTGDAGNQTGYWGYQNASQYNAGANTLTFHSTTGYTAAGSFDKDAQPFVGLDLAYGTDLIKLGPTEIGWELGAGLTPIRVRDSSSLSSTVTQSVFTFDTTGTIPPTAPYNGGPSGVGEPTIFDTPTAAGTNVSAGTVSGWRELNVILYTVRLGPTVTWNINDQFALMGGAGPALGLVDGEYKFNEAITANGSTAQNSGRIGMTKMVYGGYVNAAVLYHAVAHGDVYLGAQFMPLSSASVSGMGRDAKLDLGGALQVSAGFSWPF